MEVFYYAENLLYRLFPWHSASDSLQDVLPKRTHRLLPQGRPQLPLLRKALLKQPLPQRQNPSIP